MSHNFDTDVHEVGKLIQESEKGWGKEVKKKSLTEGKRPKKKSLMTEDKKTIIEAKNVKFYLNGDGMTNINPELDTVDTSNDKWHFDVSDKEFKTYLKKLKKLDVEVKGKKIVDKEDGYVYGMLEATEVITENAKESDYMEVMDAEETEKFMKDFKVDKSHVTKVEGGYQLDKKIAKDLASSVNYWNSGKPLDQYEKEMMSASDDIAKQMIKDVSSELGIKPKGIKWDTTLQDDGVEIEITYKGESVERTFFYYTSDQAQESVDESIQHGSLENFVWAFYYESPFYDSVFQEMVIDTEKRWGQNEYSGDASGDIMDMEHELKAMLQKTMDEDIQLSENDKVLCEHSELMDILTEGVSSNVLKQYIISALWSTNDESDESGGNPMDDNYDYDDVDKGSLRQAKKDLDKFWKMAGDLLDGEDETDIAHDFWLTRNGHGAGFWDGDYEKEKGEALTKLSEKFKEVNGYIGDDGKVYFD